MATAINRGKTGLVLLALLLASISLAPLVAAALSLSPSKTQYNPGDTLRVFGTATGNSAITIKVYNPSNNIVAIGQGNTDINGRYAIDVFTWPLTPTLTTPFGFYSITATDAATGSFTDVTVEFALFVAPPAAEGKVAAALVQIGLSNAPSYQLGETARVFASFAYNGSKVDPTSTVVLVYPPGIAPLPQALLRADAGLYYFDFKPSSIGPYAVRVEAAAKGTTNVQLTTFQVTERLATANGLANVSSVVSTKIDTSQQAVVDRITSAQTSLNGAILTSQNALNTAVTNAQSDIKTAVSNAQISLKDQITSTQTALTSSINSIKTGFGELLDSARTDIKTVVGGQITSSTKDIKDSSSGIQSAVTTAVTSVVQPLQTQMNQVTQSVDGMQKNLQSTETGVAAASTWILIIGIIAAITLVLELVTLIRKLA
ncbi:MAG: hypothetical protein M1503_09825 [Thaumarchaeota archaeon]|nr:hypothetical protein [Nitrososphaerota archaeon]MCL5318538.1 hypothetical protein [Nitrososphaerota archaeon]